MVCGTKFIQRALPTALDSTTASSIVHQLSLTPDYLDISSPNIGPALCRCGCPDGLHAARPSHLVLFAFSPFKLNLAGSGLIGSGWLVAIRSNNPLIREHGRRHVPSVKGSECPDQRADRRAKISTYVFGIVEGVVNGEVEGRLRLLDPYRYLCTLLYAYMCVVLIG